MLVCAAAMTTPKMEVTSKAFTDGSKMPDKYTCTGKNYNPPLTIKNIPIGTRTLALICDHLGQPEGTENEWVAWNIIPDGVISENNLPGITGKNTFGEHKYHAPCENGYHKYHFRIYALDKSLKLDENSDRAALENAMSGHILATAELVGTFGTPPSEENETTPPNVDR